MIRKHIHLLFICWLAYAAVPVINYIGVFNGVYVTLCATKGVMIHDRKSQFLNTAPSNAHLTYHSTIHAHHMGSSKVAQSDSHTVEHEADRCPCIHFSLDTALFFDPIQRVENTFYPIIDNKHTSPIHAIYAAQARGPPRFYRVSLMVKQHT
ncbi:MAG: hypothetical protein ACTIM4_04995 [Marinomonas sp.]